MTFLDAIREAFATALDDLVTDPRLPYDTYTQDLGAVVRRDGKIPSDPAVYDALTRVCRGMYLLSPNEQRLLASKWLEGQ